MVIGGGEAGLHDRPMHLPPMHLLKAVLAFHVTFAVGSMVVGTPVSVPCLPLATFSLMIALVTKIMFLFH